MPVKFSSKRPLTDGKEEAEIQAGIAKDPDNPELTEEQFARMRPFAEVFPELVAAQSAHAHQDREKNRALSLALPRQ